MYDHLLNSSKERKMPIPPIFVTIATFAAGIIGVIALLLGLGGGSSGGGAPVPQPPANSAKPAPSTPKAPPASKETPKPQPPTTKPAEPTTPAPAVPEPSTPAPAPKETTPAMPQPDPAPPADINDPNYRTPQSEVDKARGEILDLINKYRAENNLSQLRMNDILQKGAQRQADAMAAEDTLFHSSDSGVAEVVAWGYRLNAEEAVQSWKDSPKHNAILLTPDLTSAGVGITVEQAHGSAYLAVQFFYADSEPEPAPTQ